MDFPEPKPRLKPLWRYLGLGLAVALLAFYGSVLWKHTAAIAAGSDSSGYLNHARLLAAGHVHLEPREVPGLPSSQAPDELYMSLGFKPAWDHKGLVPTYPVGLPLLILAAKPLAGWAHAADAILLLHSLAGIALVYVLARDLGLGRRWAALGSLILALSPVYLFMSLVAMSDVPSLVWTTLAVVAALRSRGRAPWALLAGFALALDVLLRPTNVLAFIPVALALGRSPRRWLLLALGGLPGAVFYGAHSLSAYGSLFTTGYGNTSSSFSWASVPVTLAHYARWLPALFTPAVVLCLALPVERRVTASIRWLLGSWILAYGAFYSTYTITHETWWYLRFLLPAVPAILVASLLVLDRLCERLPQFLDPGRFLPAFAVALALVVFAERRQERELHPLSVGDEELVYGRATDWMKAHVPGDAVCLAMQASGALVYYTDFTFIRWDALHPSNVAKVEAAIRASGRPLYAVLFPFELTDSGALDKHMPGHWTMVGRIDQVTVWRRDFEAPKH